MPSGEVKILHQGNKGKIDKVLYKTSSLGKDIGS